MYKTLPSPITQKQNTGALILSSKLFDQRQRKRAYADFLGAMYAIDYIQSSGFRINVQRSIFKSLKLYSDYEITDIYANSHRFFILTLYGTEIVKVPFKHKEFDILPDAYIVVELKTGMKEANIKGIIKPEDLNKEPDNGYIKLNANELRNISELFDIIKKYSGIKPSIGKHLDCMSLFIPYVENKLNKEDMKKLIEHILTCETCKRRLIDMLKFDTGSKTISGHGGILSKEDLLKEENFIKKLRTSNNEGTNLKGAIDVIYKDNNFTDIKNETLKNETNIPPKTKKLILTGFTVIAVLFVIVSFALLIPNNKNEAAQGEVLPEVINEYNESQTADYEVNIPKINKSRGYMTVSKVSWEVPDRINKDEQKNFLQQAGKSIRLNLQNDLLLSNETAVNGRVKFDMGFYKDGSLEEVKVVQSSGVGAVDKIIKQSIENTLHYMRPPKGSFAGKKNDLTLVIDF